jgi:hypothetical protein
MSRVKKPLSYLDLDRANPTATLFEKIFRDSVDYRKEIDDVFDAIVLTDPTLATKDAESALKNQLITIPKEDPNKRTTYIFIARIIGRDSPHLFLPDPLEFNVTNDEECKKRYHNLLQLHTKVTANGLSALELPAKGDTVQIRLAKGDYVYKTAFCNDYLGVIAKASSTPEVVEKLKADEEGAKGAFKKNKPMPNIKPSATEYSGPLLVRRSDGLLTIGKWNQGVTPANFWKDFIKRFQDYVSAKYPELGLNTQSNGATRDLASAAKTSNGARVSGSKHGAALALDLKINTKTYGSYAGYAETNPKLATDKKLTNAIIDFMKLTEQSNLVWGGTFGGGAKSKDKLPTGKGITEFHHFEFKDSYMPTLFEPYEADLNHFGFTASQFTSTKELSKLYEALLNSKPAQAVAAADQEAAKDHSPVDNAG